METTTHTYQAGEYSPRAGRRVCALCGETQGSKFHGALADYPLYYLVGAQYTVADNEYAGMTDEVVGSLEQVQMVLSNYQGEEAQLAGTLDFRTEYQIRRVQCWYCTANATFNGKRSGMDFCPEHAAEFDAGVDL